MTKKLFTFLIFSFITGFIFSQGGVKGKITNESGNGIPLVDVYIKSLSKGATTSDNGTFEILNLENGTYNLTISSLGFASSSHSITIENNTVDLGSITLASSSQLMDEVVISGSRKLEKITESPATINVISTRQIDNFAGGTEELFAQQKGVDFGRIGAFISGVNIRGFNSAFNPKMLQLDDNRYSTLIATGLAFGPMSPIIKEDIERIETVLGPSSALYGPNALNGLINTITKSPYKYEGTDIVLGAGSNSLLSARIRHAKKIGKKEKWAYKITGEYTKGKEFNWTDSVYVPGAVVGQPEKNLVGKPEVDLDRDVEFIKGQAGIFYRPTETSEVGVSYGASQSNFLSITNTGRNSINDWRVSFLHATYKSDHWFGQIYKTWSSTEDTFNNDTRTQNYWVLISQGVSHEDALEESKTGPGAITPTFKDDSERLNTELQYNNTWGNLDFIVGAQFQRDDADSKGSYLLDADGSIQIDQIGFYGQLKYTLGDSGFKLIAAARGDDHDLFGFNFLPKAGVTYTGNSGTWRMTYGKGFATPTILNTNMSLFGGLVLGNGVGFTLSDGSKIKPLIPETVQTIEGGYKGHFIEGKLYIDVNAYYNISDEFISPLTNIVPTGLAGGPVVTHRGNEPIENLTAGLAPGVFDPGAFILTYKNFGHVNTYGLDLGLNYYISNHYNISFNYSFFDFDLDKNDMSNDGNGNGEVTNLDLPINTPKNKISTAFNVTFDKFYGSLMARWVQKYDFFSGGAAAAETNTDIIFNGDPVVENQLVGKKWNYGQLGGFYMSVNAGYKISNTFSVGAYINNFIGDGNYEFITSPPTEALYGIELKISL